MLPALLSIQCLVLLLAHTHFAFDCVTSALLLAYTFFPLDYITSGLLTHKRLPRLTLSCCLLTRSVINPMMFLTPSAPASRARGCPITSSSAQLQHPPLGVSDSSQHSLEPALFGSITLRSFLTWPQSYRLLFDWRLGVSLTKRSSFNKKQCNKIARTTDRRRAQNTHAAHTRIIGKARSDKT